jgi:uncharacterized lipoprotein YmbA
MSFSKGKLLAACVALALVACARTAPIYNVSDMPIVANKPSPSADDVRKAIIRAGGALGWQMVDQKPGLIVGTLNLREHQAVVDVSYTPQTYSITYRNSNNLSYDGTNIHKNYNGWIQNLDKAIRAQLMTL